MKLEADTNGEDIDPTLFKKLVGSLSYLCNTRLDISYSVGVVSRFMNKPKMIHYLAAIRILRYVRGTIRHGILFPTAKSSSVVNYWDTRMLIGVGIKWIGGPQLAICFFAMVLQFHGVQESNQWLLCLPPNLSTLEMM